MLAAVTDFLWSYILVGVLVVMGLTMTLRSRFVQIRYFGEMFRVLKQAFHHQAGHVSSFQALTLSVAGRVGAGNIAGVAVAITLGGPGAVFWMWMVGLIGMATSFFECSLAQAYKTRDARTGTFRGGPMYYIERGVGSRGMAMVFTLLLLVTFGLAFVALQSFTASTSLQEAFGIPTAVTGVIMTAVVGFSIFGGVQRISRVTEIIVPIMAILYIGVTVVVVGMNITQVPEVLGLIVKSAFGLEPAVGGGIGAAIMMGVRRGLFSNEAGLGSAPNVASVAYVPHPVNQGIVQSFSVFIDTAIICTATALLIILAGLHVDAETGNGVVLTQLALAQFVGPWGETFVSLVLVLFAFSSILYNFYLGENATYWMNKDDRIMFIGFRVLMLLLILWGSVQDLTTIFSFADLTMALLALVNLAALAIMMKVSFRIMDDYEDQVRQGQVPVFDPQGFDDLDLDANAWHDAADARDKVSRS
ncbi:MAG: alanine/glycine:cation symporter family protein [Wenzhouxiangella sp.]|nr:alanine/glycine:cation symporter family protein [Wenzhouxiangella sp.]MDR9452736.1 alanine/glycine:cation symporter family protein [Wenzhouxiangella sp.]